MEGTLVLVIRGLMGAALDSAIRHMGKDITVKEVICKDNETILKVDAPLGHDVYRWMHDEPNSDLIWFHHTEA